MATQVREAARTGPDQPEARRQRPRGPRAGRAPARSGREEVRRRHPDQLLRVPGPARPRPGPHQRGPRDLRLQQVARRLRGRPGSRHSAAAAAASPLSPPAPVLFLAWLDEVGQALSGPEGPHYDCRAGPYPPCPSPAPARLLHSPRAEALGHGHHAERSGEHRARRSSRSPGPTRSSSSTPRAPTTRSRIARAVHRPRRRAAVGRATSRRRTSPRRWPPTTGFCRSTPTSA